MSIVLLLTINVASSNKKMTAFYSESTYLCSYIIFNFAALKIDHSKEMFNINGI
jgi:hypothetical protein